MCCRAGRPTPPRAPVTGTGLHYGVDRKLLARGPFTLRFDDIHIFETNRPETMVQSGAVVMGVLTGASLALSGLCLTNPKACFGSCPTFYVSNGDKLVLQAEGFSDAIAPSLKKTTSMRSTSQRPAATRSRCG